jgi:integrase/recombinase XerD
VQLRVEDLHLALDPPQVYIAHAKGGSDGYVPILPASRKNSAST